MREGFNAKRVALSGVLGAFAIICLFFAVYVPTGRLGFYVLSSFFCAVIVMEFGAKAGWVFYMATGLLALAVVPDKTGVLPYILFFGLYGIIKFYIEKLQRFVPELLLKLVFFNLCMGAAYLLVKQLFFISAGIKFPWYVLIIGLEIAFALYDYVYSLFVAYYNAHGHSFFH